MSTGHRPTFHPAVGKQVFGGGSGYHIVSVKDQLGQKNLKFRKLGQSSQNEIRSRDYKAELQIIEEEHLSVKKKELARITSSKPENISELPRLLTDAPMQSTDELRKKYDDSDAENGESDNELESRWEIFCTRTSSILYTNLSFLQLSNSAMTITKAMKMTKWSCKWNWRELKPSVLPP